MNIADQLIARSTAGLPVTITLSAQDARELGVYVRRAAAIPGLAADFESAVRRKAHWSVVQSFFWGAAAGLLLGASLMAGVL